MIAALLAALALAAAPPSSANDTAKSAASAAPAPSPEAMALARKVAARDDFLVAIETISAGQIGDVEHGMGDLSAAEKDKVADIGRQKMAEGMGRVVEKLAAIYAQKFSVEDLRAIDAFLETPAGKAYSGRLAATLMAVGESMKGFDYKREVRAEACAEIKKGCEAEAPMKMPPPVKSGEPVPGPKK
jgi:hypothetical protein